ncbi:MAG TPA: thiamine phosphate synthase [Xanthobacteraceae bacterium]|nr:thiamine phosphate synthase [Xanthobacteraceae bacterium]
MVEQYYRLCLVTDHALARGRSLAEIVAAAVKGGVTMIQLREKAAPTRAFIEEARTLKRLLAPLGVPLLVNDRIDVALAAGADGAHVGQHDMPVALARRLLGPAAIIGLSITELDEVRGADVELADYLGVGPIFAQSTKLDATPPLGLEGLAAVRRATRKRIMAIGGVSAANASAVRSAGADGIAVVSAIMGAEDPLAAARALASAADFRRLKTG